MPHGRPVQQPRQRNQRNHHHTSQWHMHLTCLPARPVRYTDNSCVYLLYVSFLGTVFFFTEQGLNIVWRLEVTTDISTLSGLTADLYCFFPSQDASQPLSQGPLTQGGMSMSQPMASQPLSQPDLSQVTCSPFLYTWFLSQSGRVLRCHGGWIECT